MEKASKLIPIPKIIEVSEEKKEIKMNFLNGKKLSGYLDKFPLKKQKSICRNIGVNVAKLHDSDIIHGDLTTSNMIYVGGKKPYNKKLVNDKKQGAANLKISLGRGGFKIYFIDFGLGFISKKIEDKAVDLHLLKQALEAKHFKNWKVLFSESLKGYSLSKNHQAVLKQLEKVEKRGRYKNSY